MSDKSPIQEIKGHQAQQFREGPYLYNTLTLFPNLYVPGRSNFVQRNLPVDEVYTLSGTAGPVSSLTHISETRPVDRCCGFVDSMGCLLISK